MSETEPETDYLRRLDHERHMFVWCLARYGGLSPEAAAEQAAGFYAYHSPDDEHRSLVFHDEAWHWAMLQVRGAHYWKTHPQLASAGVDYRLEAEAHLRNDLGEKDGSPKPPALNE